MRKFIILMGTLFFLSVTSGTAYSKDLDLIIKEYRCTGDGVKIFYSVKNSRSFTRPNIGIGFKIMVDGKPIGCASMYIDVPADEKGDEIREITISAPCRGKNFKIVSTIFGTNVARYKVENWMSGCP